MNPTAIWQCLSSLVSTVYSSIGSIVRAFSPTSSVARVICSHGKMFRVWCREVSANGEDKPLRAKSEDEENLLIFRKAPERVAWLNSTWRDGSRWYLQSLHCCLPTSCLQCAHDVRRHDIMSTYQLPRWVTHRFTMTEDKLMQNGWREDTSCLLPHRCWTTFGRTLWGHPNHPRQRKAWQDSMEAMAAMACSRCLLADPVIGCQCDRVATQVIYTWTWRADDVSRLVGERFRNISDC